MLMQKLLSLSDESDISIFHPFGIRRFPESTIFWAVKVILVLRRVGLMLRGDFSDSDESDAIIMEVKG